MDAVISVEFTRIPIIGIPEFVCDVRTTADGRTVDHDGDVIPMERRPRECGRDGTWLIGRQPVCDQHFREAVHLMELDADEIIADVRGKL